MSHRTRPINITKSPPKTIAAPMILPGLIDSGLKREVKRILGSSTVVYATEPRPGPSINPLHEVSSVTVGPAMLEVRSLAARMAEADLPVLLIGGNAVAVDAVARLIHKLSARRKRGFVQVSCDARSVESLERKLFGSEVETSHGPAAAPMGIFEACQGGTVFLDSITDLPWRLQARLLDLLDQHRLRRTEGRAWVHVDVRIVASTSMDTQEALASGKLREDLYLRLESLTLRLPRFEEKGVETARTPGGSSVIMGDDVDSMRAPLHATLQHSS